MQCSGCGKKSQASLLLVSVVAIAAFLGWVYMKYIGLGTFYSSVANTYDIERAMYREKLVKNYIDTAARLSYQMALSEISRDDDFSRVPFMINNRLYIPDEKYFEGRLGELTLNYTNSFVENIGKELGVEVDTFKCFNIERNGDRMRITLSGGRIRINESVGIDTPLNVSFEAKTSVFELYRKNREIIEEFFNKGDRVKTACEFSVDFCNNLGAYMQAHNIAKELEEIAQRKSSGGIVCTVGIEKTMIAEYPTDTQCKIAGTCRLLPREKAFIGTGVSCEPMEIPPPEDTRKDFFKEKGPNFQSCYEYRRRVIEYEIVVSCRKRGEFVFDEKEKKYKELEFGSVVWSKADSDYGCVRKGDVLGTNKFAGKADDGTCLCTNICTICGNSREFASPCDCDKPVVDENGIVVAGPGFNAAAFLSAYAGQLGHDECEGLDPDDTSQWPQTCIDLLSSIQPLCISHTCSPPVPNPPPAG